MACEEVVCKTIDIRTEGATKSLDQVEDSMASVGEQSKGLKAGMEDLPGPMGKAQGAVGKLSKAFKALLANPIVLLIAAIVAGLVALFKAFTKSEAGADKMKETMAAVSAAIDVVIARAAKLFQALVKLFKGDFKGGFEDMKTAVSGVKDELREATQAAIELEKAQRRLFITETELITANSSRLAQIAELKLVTQDLTKSVDERRIAIEKANAIEKAMLQDSLDLQQQRVDIAQQELDNIAEGMPVREAQRALAEEMARLDELKVESFGKQEELQGRLNALDAEAEAQRQAAHDAELARMQEIADKEEELRQERLAKEKEARELDLQLNEEMDSVFVDMNDAMDDYIEQADAESTAQMIANAEARFDFEDKMLQEQLANELKVQAVKRQIYQDSLTALIGFLGEGSRIGKALQIADATKSAIQGAIATYSSVSAIPVAGPVLAPIAAAAALAVGMLNVKKIASTPDPLGGGGGSVPSVSLATPQASLPDLTNASQGIPSEVNIVQDQTATKGAAKAYVVQSEVTAEQDIQAKREADVTL